MISASCRPAVRLSKGERDRTNCVRMWRERGSQLFQGSHVTHGAATSRPQLKHPQSKGGIMAEGIYKENSYLCFIMDVLLYSESLGEL